MENATSKEAYEEDKRIKDELEARKAAIAQEIHERDQAQRIYEAREAGIEAGIEKGRKAARKKGKAKIALNMYKKQLPIDEIADLTDMSMEEVLDIVKSNIQ